MTRYYDEQKHKFITETEYGDIIGETEYGDIIGETDLDASNCDSVAQAKYLIRKYREEIEYANESLKKLNKLYPQDDFPEMWL